MTVAGQASAGGLIDYHHWHQPQPGDEPECCLCRGDGCDDVATATRSEHAAEDAAHEALVDTYDREGWPF
jgi:hypothetical protein